MSFLGVLGAGAGLLAKGVGSLFSGQGKAARQEKRAERKLGRVERREERRSGRMESIGTGIYDAATALPSEKTGDVAPGDFESAPPPSGRSRGMAGAGDFLTKNWMWLALAALVLFGGKLFKTRRAPRRRAAKPKTVIRYRTRKAPAKRR